MFWKPNVQQCKYGYQYYIVYLKFTKILIVLKPKERKKMITDVIDMLINLIIVFISKCILYQNIKWYILNMQFLFVNYTSISMGKSLFLDM